MMRVEVVVSRIENLSQRGERVGQHLTSTSMVTCLTRLRPLLWLLDGSPPPSPLKPSHIADEEMMMASAHSHHTLADEEMMVASTHSHHAQSSEAAAAVVDGVCQERRGHGGGVGPEEGQELADMEARVPAQDHEGAAEGMGRALERGGRVRLGCGASGGGEAGAEAGERRGGGEQGTRNLRWNAGAPVAVDLEGRQELALQAGGDDSASDTVLGVEGTDGVGVSALSQYLATRPADVCSEGGRGGEGPALSPLSQYLQADGRVMREAIARSGSAEGLLQEWLRWQSLGAQWERDGGEREGRERGGGEWIEGEKKGVTVVTEARSEDSRDGRAWKVREDRLRVRGQEREEAAVGGEVDSRVERARLLVEKVEREREWVDKERRWMCHRQVLLKLLFTCE